MSGATAAKAYFYEADSVTSEGAVTIDLSKRIKTQLTNPTESETNPLTFFGDWTPIYYNISEKTEE